MYCLAVHDTLMGILPTPTIFGLIVLRCANTDAAGLVIKETPLNVKGFTNSHKRDYLLNVPLRN